MDKRLTAEYLSISMRNLEKRFKRIPHFRLGGKALFKKSEIEHYMEQHRENPETLDLKQLADEVVKEVLGKKRQRQ